MPALRSVPARLAVLFPLVALAIILPAGPGQAAQHRRGPPPQTDNGPGSYADPYFGRQNGQVCRRWCLEDRNPCDPPNFKEQDGRCDDD